MAPGRTSVLKERLWETRWITRFLAGANDDRVLWAVKVEQGNRISVGQALDVSGWGAKVRTSERFEINSKVVLTIADLGRFSGEIRWQRDGYVGIAFAEMASAVEDRLRHRATPAADANPSTKTCTCPLSVSKARARGHERLSRPTGRVKSWEA